MKFSSTFVKKLQSSAFEHFTAGFFVHQGIGRRDVDFGNFGYDTSLKELLQSSGEAA